MSGVILSAAVSTPFDWLSVFIALIGLAYGFEAWVKIGLGGK